MSVSTVALKARPKEQQSPRPRRERRAGNPPVKRPKIVKPKPCQNTSARVLRGMMLIVEGIDAVECASKSIMLLHFNQKRKKRLGQKWRNHWQNVYAVTRITDRLLGIGHCGRAFSVGSLSKVEAVDSVQEIHAELAHARDCFKEAGEWSPQWEEACDSLATMIGLVVHLLESDL